MTFACHACQQPGRRNQTIILILKKFTNALLLNHGNMMTDLQPGRAVVTSNKKQNRKYQTFS